MASGFKFKWTKDFEAHASKSSEAAAKDAFTLLNQEFQRAITAKAWAWPTVPTKRDIVDTGALRQSNVFAVSRMTAVFRWTKNYASFVHEGAMEGGRNYPPRPWTDAVLYGENGFNKYDLSGTFKKLWVRYYSGKG